MPSITWKLPLVDTSALYPMNDPFFIWPTLTPEEVILMHASNEPTRDWALAAFPFAVSALVCACLMLTVRLSLVCVSVVDRFCTVVFVAYVSDTELLMLVAVCSTLLLVAYVDSTSLRSCSALSR